MTGWRSNGVRINCRLCSDFCSGDDTMRRWSAILLIAASCCFGMSTMAAADCKSVQAQCAVEAGGRCDAQTGHWCYGNYRGEQCGGTGSAFRACMTRHGVQVYGPQVPKAPGPAATSSDLGKCTSIQAQCALEIGGSCDRNTATARCLLAIAAAATGSSTAACHASSANTNNCDARACGSARRPARILPRSGRRCRRAR